MFLLNKTSLVFCSLRSQNTLSPKGKASEIFLLAIKKDYIRKIGSLSFFAVPVRVFRF